MRIQTSAPSSTGHLEKLTTHQRPMTSLRSLGERRDHSCSRRHVDSCRQCFCGKDNLDEAKLEHLLDKLLPCRQDTGMMGSNAVKQCCYVTFANCLRG
ncbi:protein of unknown function [Cyanobium sp. NIES-981]|nr:protein of unknown function [Cyanobium sp. NIES-981]